MSIQNIEIMSLIIKRKFQISFCVTVVYIPPDAKVEKAIESLEKVSDYVTLNNYEWIMGGDFNIDLCKKKT